MPRLHAGGREMVDAVFDPRSGVLSNFSKGRGLAHCGSSEAWAWAGSGFRLKFLNELRQCGGTAPGDWPPLYRTR